MIIGDSVFIKIGGKIVALQKTCKLSASVEMVEVTPLPNSEEDDGWTHYERGETSWEASSDNFVSVGEGSYMPLVGDVAEIEFNFGKISLSGKAFVAKAKLTAQYKSHATVSLSLVGEDFLKLA